MEEKKKFPVIYLLAILYALSAYLGPVAFLIMSDSDAADKVTSWLFWLPVILGIVNLIVVCADSLLSGWRTSDCSLPAVNGYADCNYGVRRPCDGIDTWDIWLAYSACGCTIFSGLHCPVL